MSKRKRVAVGAIFTECNMLGGLPIDMGWFERYELARGDAVLEIGTGTLHAHDASWRGSGHPLSMPWYIS